MCDRARPIVTLLIAPDSPLAKGRIPKSATELEDGIRVSFDPVSYGALRASIGEFIPLLEVLAMFAEAIQKKLEEDAAEARNTHENGDGTQ
ncbi:MAG: hypothetical protein E3J69_12620 [Anaerolineales bacterium]|nr:MAG: hypothetical protein E3J69_12620 [Anaerolineales bacterium]